MVKQPVANGRPHSNNLSKREKQVLALLLDGNSVTTIASQLKVTVQTVSTLKTRLFKKMEVSNLLELIKKAK